MIIRNKKSVKRRLSANSKRGTPTSGPTGRGGTASNVEFSKLDPTRTITLRRAACSAMRRKFAILKGKLVKLILVEDALGLKERKPLLRLNNLATNEGGWVTLETGQHVYIGDDGSLYPKGPPSKEEKPQPVTQPKQPRVDYRTAMTKIADVTKKGLASANLTPDQARNYRDTVKSVAQNMPEAALALIHDHLSTVNFHLDTRSVSLDVVKGGKIAQATLDGINAGKITVGGFYRKSDTSLNLDGGTKNLSQEGIYAHEMTHAIDGPSNHISDSPEWHSAFSQELRAGQLTKYGATSRSEGLAEFGRLMYTGTPHAELQARFPQCFRVFESRGLVSNVSHSVKNAAAPSRYPDLFNKYVDMGGGDHADAYEKKPAENLERIEMPQIRKEYWEKFLAFAREKTALTSETGVDPKRLKAVQHEFDQARVDAIPTEKLEWPILISRDGYVLDGNHRWIKAYQTGHTMKVLRLGLDRDDALEVMRSFPQSEFVDNWCNQYGGDACSTGEQRRGLSAKAIDLVKGKYAKFSERYGKRGAIAIMAAMAMTMPLPGNVLAVLGIAEGVRYAMGKLTGTATTNESYGISDDVLDDARSLAEGLGLEFDPKIFSQEYVRQLEKAAPDQSPMTGITNRWQFATSPDKIAEFTKWLREQFKAEFLGKKDEDLWKMFAQRGFAKGAGRAWDDVSKASRWKPGEGDFYKGSRESFLRQSFGHPETKEKLQLLASRSFTDLRNVTEDMATRMGRRLMDGLAQGQNPREMIDGLVEDLNVSEARAETIARTEIIRAHAEGQLDAMEKMGVEEVGVAVEWSTAGDGPKSEGGRVCNLCYPLEGVVLTIAEAHGLIPAHPNCRCSFMPANTGEDDSKQKRTKEEIDDAFKEAEWDDPPEIDEERPKPLVDPTKNMMRELREFSRFVQSFSYPAEDER